MPDLAPAQVTVLSATGETILSEDGEAGSEGASCSCTGTVYYGRRFVSGRPGSGTTTTLYELQQSGHTVRENSGSITCSNGVFGDPLGGVYKHCYCDPSTSYFQGWLRSVATWDRPLKDEDVRDRSG